MGTDDAVIWGLEKLQHHFVLLLNLLIVFLRKFRRKIIYNQICIQNKKQLEKMSRKLYNNRDKKQGEWFYG